MTESVDFRLDPVNQCLWRGTGSGEYERVLLTRAEFGVLDHLVEHAGRLVTHRELLDAVWPRTVIEPQAVKSKVFHLRRALGDDPKQPRFIETLSRRGYRFVGKIERGGGEDVRVPPQNTHLVGRDGALAELQQCIRSAGAGRLQIAFVTGEAGIGKTTLVEEFQRQVAASGFAVRVARGQCVEGFGSREAFYPVLAAVGQLCRGLDGARVVETLASQAPTWLVQFPALLTRQHREMLQQEILGTTRERMLREISEALETIAAPIPLLLVLEDLHWGDPSTLDLISALARRHLPARIMVIATYRPVEVARSAHPLNALKRDLVARHQCREIAVQPLNQAEIAQYLASAGSSPEVLQELASLLHRHTEGNPLFTIAVLEHLVERGLVKREHGGWTLHRPTAEISLTVPESLRDMIGAQIEQLEEHDQRVLEVAAIAGMAFGPAICAPSADMDARAFDECCDALARRGHMLRLADARQLPDGRLVQRYAFVHALYREVLYERQPPARRATLHRRRAEQLEEVFATALDDVEPELAHHFEKGADWARAVKYLRQVADMAARRGALEAAAGNLEHALALAAKLPIGERAVIETEILNALADMYLGTFDARAGDVLALLRERAAQYGLVDVEAKAVVDLVYPLAWVDAQQAVEVIEHALRLGEAQQDPLMRACTRARCMVRRIWIRGWCEEDAAACRLALDEIRHLAGRREVARHVLDCHLVDFFSSAYRQASRDVIESLAILKEEGGETAYLSYAQSVRELGLPWCCILLGEWGAALREIDTGVAVAERNGDARRGQTLLLSRAWVLLHAMDFAGARAICDALLLDFQEPTRRPWRRYCLTLGGAAEVGLGNHEGALSRLLTAREEMDRHMALGDWYWRLRLEWALANLWLSAGDLARAGQEAERFVAGASATAERSWQALAWDTSARIALASGDLRRAQDLIGHALVAIESVEAPVAGWQSHATAAEVALARGDTVAATYHRETSRNIILRLAASLGPDREVLRRTFLASPSVGRILTSLHGQGIAAETIR